MNKKIATADYQNVAISLVAEAGLEHATSRL